MLRSIWNRARLALLILASLTITAAATGSAMEAQPGGPPGLFATSGAARAAAWDADQRLALDPALTESLTTIRDAEVRPGGRWRLAQSGTGPAGKQEAPQAGGAAAVGAKLSDPTSDVWALFTEFDLTFNDGDVNTGDPQVGFQMLFQPILPLPMFGKWKLITRPTIPIIFSQPVPEGFDDFDHKIGLGDSLLPLVLSPPSKHWILALGPTFTFPTSTVDAFGRQQ